MVLVLLALFGLLACLFVVLKFKMSSGRKRDTKTIKTMVVLGSGGHTTEMISLLGAMDSAKYAPRQYVVANTDALSATKAMNLERKRGGMEQSSIVKIPRSREVGQSFLTSAWTTLHAFAHCAGIVWRDKPNLVLVNGPGTCIPVCLAAFAYRSLGLMHVSVVYFESIARVKSLSLTGKILYKSRLTDLFLVQWPELKQRFPRSEYRGRLF